MQCIEPPWPSCRLCRPLSLVQQQLPPLQCQRRQLGYAPAALRFIPGPLQQPAPGQNHHRFRNPLAKPFSRETYLLVPAQVMPRTYSCLSDEQSCSSALHGWLQLYKLLAHTTHATQPVAGLADLQVAHRPPGQQIPIIQPHRPQPGCAARSWSGR